MSRKDRKRINTAMRAGHPPSYVQGRRPLFEGSLNIFGGGDRLEALDYVNKRRKHFGLSMLSSAILQRSNNAQT